MHRLEKGKKVGIVCCSNGQKKTYAEKLMVLRDSLQSLYMPKLQDKLLLLEGRSGTVAQMETLLKRMVRADMPIAVTRQIVHGTDAKGIVIGEERRF